MAEPPLADLGKSAAEDDSRLVWLLLRTRDEDGKWRFLLQQRDDGTWGMPGGTPHIGEDPWAAALRETTEEIGDLPAGLKIAGMFHHREDDGGTQVYLWLCDVPYFKPLLNGATPEETRAAAWFRRKEIASLDLAPKFRDDWEHGVCLKDNVTKAAKPLQRMVNENGETLTLTPASGAVQGLGARWPYPHRDDGSEWPDAGPGSYPGGSPGGEPPHWSNDMAAPEPRDTLEPRGGDDGKMPEGGRIPPPPAEVFPNQGSAHDDMWPAPQVTLTPRPASPVGANTGVPPSGEKQAKVSKESVNYRQGTPARHCGNCVMFCPRTTVEPIVGNCDLVRGDVYSKNICDRWSPRDAAKNDSGHPVVGSVSAQTPQPYKPHSVEPEAFDPAETVEDWQPESDTNVVHDLPRSGKKGRGGPADHSDPNPVDAHHVYLLMSSNFPPKAIEWVKRARWVGPVNIPWDRIDTHDIKSWAASHQPGRVKEFEQMIRAHKGNVKPSILIQDNDSPKAIIIDGHHRGIAHNNMGQPVLAYLGIIDPKDREAAEQTHSAQIHSGTDRRNT